MSSRSSQVTTSNPTTSITFLDHAKPGKATAPEWPKEKQFKATVVDELGNTVPHVWLYFRHGKAYNLVRTDDDGVATYKTTSDVESVNVSFESADDLAQAMKPRWSKSHGTPRKDWVKADDTTSTVSIFGGKIVFSGLIRSLSPTAFDQDSGYSIRDRSEARENERSRLVKQ